MAEQAKLFRLSGAHVKNYGRMKWISSGSDCGDNVAPLVSGGDDGHNAMNIISGRVSFLFSAAAAGKTVSMCYSSNAEPFKFYPQYSLFVGHLATISASRGSNDTAVLSTLKVLNLGGHGFSDTDYIKWVQNNSDGIISCWFSSA